MLTGWTKLYVHVPFSAGLLMYRIKDGASGMKKPHSSEDEQGMFRAASFRPIQ